MAVPAGKPRQRAWKPKNRTGCKTCKIRKVKCDEEKPHCKRCTSTGRTCDGYDINFRPASHSAGNSPPSSKGSLHPGRELVRSISPVPLAPALSLKTEQERASFEFFATHAVSSLRGFLDSSFWQREILQAAHQHESIQHCIVALGAMHRRFYEGSHSHISDTDMANEHLQFALRQSNQAIQGLVKASGPGGRIARADRVTLMTCAVLFSSMACLQGHQRDGLQHLRSGIRLLKEIDSVEEEKQERHPIDVGSLRAIFTGLDLQARSIMNSADAREWESVPHAKVPSISVDADLDSSTLVAVQLHIQALINTVLAFVQRVADRDFNERDAVYFEYRRLLTRFDHSTELLERLILKAASSTGDFFEPLTALQLLHAQLEYYLRSPRADLEEKFSFLGEPFSEPYDPVAHFTKILHLASSLLNQDASHSPVFTTTMGPLPALWLIATRAPSICTAIRKRAVRLMLSYPRREGFWDGLVAGQLAQEVLRLEQEATREELGLVDMPTRDLVVPDDLRIVVVALKYDKENDRTATVEFRNKRNMALKETLKVQHLAW